MQKCSTNFVCLFDLVMQQDAGSPRRCREGDGPQQMSINEEQQSSLSPSSNPAVRTGHAGKGGHCRRVAWLDVGLGLMREGEEPSRNKKLKLNTRVLI
ncbi:hypothetical protein ACOMHN_063115 [Nucella lapillus]